MNETGTHDSIIDKKDWNIIVYQIRYLHLGRNDWIMRLLQPFEKFKGN